MPGRQKECSLRQLPGQPVLPPSSCLPLLPSCLVSSPSPSETVPCFVSVVSPPIRDRGSFYRHTKWQAVFILKDYRCVQVVVCGFFSHLILLLSGRVGEHRLRLAGHSTIAQGTSTCLKEAVCMEVGCDRDSQLQSVMHLHSCKIKCKHSHCHTIWEVWIRIPGSQQEDGRGRRFPGSERRAKGR